MKKQKFLVLGSPYSWGGGIKTMIDEGLKMLESLGYQTTLVLPSYVKEKNSSRVRAKKFSTVRFAHFDKYPLFHHLEFGLRLKKLRQQYGGALAIVATSHTALPLALSGKPFSIWVATSYGDELESKFNSDLGDESAKRLRYSVQWRLLEIVEKYVLRKATNILALSDYTALELQRLEPRIKTKLKVLNIPVDTELFSPNALIKKVDGLVVNTGRINDPRKNTHLLIKSFARVVQSFPQARLLLIGDSVNNHLAKIIKSLGLDRSVEIIPERPREQLTNYLRKAQIFVATPIQEGLGISILEAMSCELPVVITRCGGPETIIKKSRGGIIVNNNERDFSKAIVNLLSNNRLRMKMGRKGREYIQKKLTFTLQKKKLALELSKQYEKN